MPVFDPVFRNWISGVELVLRRGVHYMSFKDGIFQRSIPTSSPWTTDTTIKAFATLLAQPSLIYSERRTLTIIRDLYVKMLTAHGQDLPIEIIMSVMSMGDHVLPTMMVSDDDHARMAKAIIELEDMFDTDRSERGIRIPSRGYQFVGEDKQVKKTIFFDVDMHQLVVEGNYFREVEMIEGADYYDVPKGGPGGLTLRYLTARFMMTQGCQTPEYNDLAFCEKQKAEVMQLVRAQGPETIPANTDSNGMPITPEEHHLQQPIMVLRASKVALHLYGTLPTPARSPQNNDHIDDDFSSESDSDDDIFVSQEPPKKKNKTRGRPPKKAGASGPEKTGFDKFQAKRQIKSAQRAAAVARKNVKYVTAAVDSSVKGVGAAVDSMNAAVDSAYHRVGAAITSLKNAKARLG